MREINDKEIIKLYMEQNSATEEEAVNWYLDILAEEDKFIRESMANLKTSGKFSPLRDYIEELEKRLQ